MLDRQKGHEPGANDHVKNGAWLDQHKLQDCINKGNVMNKLNISDVLYIV